MESRGGSYALIGRKEAQDAEKRGDFTGGNGGSGGEGACLQAIRQVSHKRHKAHKGEDISQKTGKEAAADFFLDKDGIYRLKSDRRTPGCRRGVQRYQSFGDRGECMLRQYSGPLGGVGFICALKRIDGRWQVVGVKVDNSAVS
jgi:hypothetical protein